MLNFTKHSFVLVLALIIGATTSCKKKDEDVPAPSAPAFRTNKIDYNTLTASTSYRTAFKNEAGDTTVDRNIGRARLKMFRGFSAYITSSISAGTTISETKLNDLFTNTGSPFEGEFADLNDLDISIKEATAASKSNQSDVYNYLGDAFAKMAEISTKGSQTASKGTAGKSGTYLLDENGIEWWQIIQKGLIGAYHMDYIGNVLLNTGLNADNTRLVAGKKYTQLEQNWDEAYGFLTFNDIYYNGATAEGAPKIDNSIAEYYLGTYAWEYNKKGFGKLHSAFLKGRAAIHNNDMNEVRAQAAIIRDIFEKAIAASVEGYMYKAGLAASSESSRAHQFGEGLGFIYSTRFCTLSGADESFSDGLENSLKNNGKVIFYDITITQYTAVRDAIMTKFGLVIVH